MPLQIVFRGARNCPVVTCDHCGEEITQATQGNYYWQAFAPEPSRQPLFFAHKRCSRAFEAANPPAPETRWSFGELRELPVYLARNLELNLAEAEARVDAGNGI